MSWLLWHENSSLTFAKRISSQDSSTLSAACCSEEEVGLNLLAPYFQFIANKIRQENVDLVENFPQVYQRVNIPIGKERF